MSTNLNFEVNGLIYSPSLLRVLQEQFETDLRDSREIDLETFRRRRRREQLAENVCRLMSPIL